MNAEDRRRQKVMVVIPGYNEEKRIASVVRDVRSHNLDVLVVDDGSDNRTSEEAQRAGAQVLKHEQNQGKGVALNAGFKYARGHGYNVVITMDADGQHDPSDIPRFIEAYVRTGIPVLIGNRMADVRTMPRIRRWTNEFMSWILSKFMGQYVPDTQCGYRLYRSDVIPYISASSERFAAESETLLNVAARGMRIDSVRVATIYMGEKSSIHPVADTRRFFSMLWKFWKKSRKWPSQMWNR